MRGFRSLVLVAAFVLVPALAHASWLDWLNRLSGPGPFIGVGEDFDVLCFNEAGNTYPLCNGVVLFRPSPEIPGVRPKIDSLDELKHVITARADFYWTRKGAERFEDVTGDTRQVRAVRLVGLYQRRFTRELQAGMGAGLMRFSGDGFNSFTRGIVVPVSVTFGPFEHTTGVLKPIRLVFEEAYIFRGFNGATFGNTVTTFDTHGGEWRPTFKVAYDLRHLR